MMKLIVNIDNYSPFNYTKFIEGGFKEIKRPNDTKYEVGQVVYNKEENSLGVVLGVIDNKSEELRTDMNGMVCFENIRPATKGDFLIDDVKVLDRLKHEVSGRTVSYNWKTYVLEVS